MSKEQMKLILEALESLTRYDMVRANIFRQFHPTATGDYVNLQEFREKTKPLITALREALAKPDFWEGYVPEPVKPATEESSATQAQQALDKKAENARELGLDYEPVCNKDPQGCWNVRCQLGKKCKNTSPQRTWVGLTDGELPAMWTDAVRKAALPPNKSALIHYKEAIEAKLKEKNI